MFECVHVCLNVRMCVCIGVLSSCANAGVVVVRYSHDNTSLSGLLASISRHLKGRLALSIALLMDGKPGSVKICSQKVVLPDLLLCYCMLLKWSYRDFNHTALIHSISSVCYEASFVSRYWLSLHC